MAKDRLEELRKESATISPKNKMKAIWSKANTEDGVSLTQNFKLPSIGKSQKKEQESLDGIFKQVNMITKWIESIKTDTTLLKQCHTVLQHSTRPETSMKDKIQTLMGNIRSLSSRTKGSLEEMRKRKENEVDSGVRRIIETQYMILSKNFSDTIEEYRTTLDFYKRRNEDILKKQLLITDKEVTSEELSNLLDSEDTAIFADDYLKDMSIARQQLQEARTRHAEILAIEKEIIEIRTLFMDLAMHVNIQGEMIENIEYYVNKGVSKAHGGAEQLAKAKTKKKNYRRKKIMLFVCLAIVIFILLLVLLI